jgi:hypothetical protein
MRIPTRDVPQADDLRLVVRSVEAVSRGARTFQDIAREIGEYDPRQGRYYRRAAEILGLITNNPGQNRALLTPAGRELVQAPQEHQQELLARAILGARVFQRIIPFLESKRDQGITRQQLKEFIGEVTATTDAMLNRRCSSVVAWLTEIGLLRPQADRLILQQLPVGVNVVDYTEDDEPLLPPSYDLTEYEEVARRTKQDLQTVRMLVNAAANERAANSHRILTNLVATQIRGVGAIPRRNRFIDLLARIENKVYLFEMKSTTDRNYHAQIRRGISQLFEYRYIQHIPAPILVLVTEQRPPRALRWIVDYLVDSLGILLAWDGDGRTLAVPAKLHRDLQFLL